MKKQQKKKYKKPNAVVYKLFYWACKLIAKLKFNLKINRNELKTAKSPYVILANHESSIDFINVCVVNKRRLNFIISNSFYETLSIQPLMKAAGVLPKNQFQTMVEDMKKMKACLDNGMPIAIFPAGLMSADGESTPISASTGKSLKWFDKDVYVVKSTGSYLTMPKWSSKMRKGKITVDAYKLFSVDEVRALNEKELQSKLEEALYFDAYKNQCENPVAYKGGDDISGLENVLYKCPHCKKEFAMAVENLSVIKCKECGYQAKADVYGFLNKSGENEVYKLPSDWYRFIESELRREIEAIENYSLSSECEIQKINKKKHKFEKYCDGFISLDKDKFVLVGAYNGEEFEKEFSTVTFPVLPFKPGKYFEIQEKKDIYRICLKNGCEVTKWITALKIFFKIRNENLNK